MSNRIKQMIAVLKALKGVNEEQLAKEINYSRSHLNVLINKDDEEAIQKFVKIVRKKWPEEIKQIERLLQASADENSMLLNEPDENYENKPSPLKDIILQQNKLLQSLNNQSETSNIILKRLADNVEVKVERIDINVSETLGKLNKIITHLNGSGSHSKSKS